MNLKIKPVCMNCTERHDCCHDTCEKYIQAKKELEERKQKIYSSQEYQGDLLEKQRAYRINESTARYRVRIKRTGHNR